MKAKRFLRGLLTRLADCLSKAWRRTCKTLYLILAGIYKQRFQEWLLMQSWPEYDAEFGQLDIEPFTRITD